MLYSSEPHIIEYDNQISLKNELKIQDLAKDENEKEILTKEFHESEGKKAPKDKIIVISVDGLRTDYVEGLSDTFSDEERDLFDY